MLAGLTDPPYWMRTAPAAAGPVACWPPRPGWRRTTAWASSGVAVRPVPMAQIGS